MSRRCRSLERWSAGRLIQIHWSARESVRFFVSAASAGLVAPAA
jgi:hypothetical protein